MKTAIAVTLALAAGALGGPSGLAGSAASMPAPPGLAATDVSFEGSGGLTLHGTVLTPRRSPQETKAERPGVVLVTGSGSGVPREHLLTEATEFARRGLAVLIYDKRSAGYTEFRRSYSELADDALGAVRALRARPGVDPAKVGIWGLSEGGWVAPLAASRSADVAFVIVVGGNAMRPIRQQTWNEASTLRRRGVSGSLIDRGKLNLARLAADVGLFAEARHDARAVLERVRQPLLGVWGGHDLQTPPEDNPPLFAQALRSGGNAHYTFRYFAEADHAVHLTPDGGATRGTALAPGYADLVSSWVREVTSGRPPTADAADLGALPKQDYPSTEVAPLAWWESAWAQLAAFALFVLGFATYPLVVVVRRLRGRGTAPVSRSARLLAGAGILTAPGMFVYLLSLASASRSPALGPVVLGRPLPWLVLQWLAVTAVIAAGATAVAWWRAGRTVRPGERLRLGLLLAAGAGFVPWAFYWGLLLP